MVALSPLQKHQRTNGCTPSPRVAVGQWLLFRSDRVILVVRPAIENMILYIIIGIVLLIVAVVAVLMVLGGTVKADVIVAVEKGEYQFIALMEPDGTVIHPKVDGIPDWYLEVSGFTIQQTNPDTKAKDLEYMETYNQVMYETLKEQEKLHLIEKEIEAVGRNLGKISEIVVDSRG